MGIPAVTGSSGKNSLRADMLDGYRKPILVLPDKGEEQTAEKLIAELGWRGSLLKYEYPPECKDPNDLLVKGYKEELWQYLSSKTPR